VLICARTLVVVPLVLLIAATNAVASSSWPRVEVTPFAAHAGIRALEATQPEADQDQQPLTGWSLSLNASSQHGSSFGGPLFSGLLTTQDNAAIDRAAIPASIIEHIADANNPVLPFAQVRNAARRASYALTVDSIVQRGIAMPMSEELVQPRQLDTQRYAGPEFSMGFFIPGTGSVSILAMGGLLRSKRRRTG